MFIFFLKDSELEGERERLSDMQKVYTNQDLTPADVARLKAEQGRLRQQVRVAGFPLDIFCYNLYYKFCKSCNFSKTEVTCATIHKRLPALKLSQSYLIEYRYGHTSFKNL